MYNFNIIKLGAISSTSNLLKEKYHQGKVKNNDLIIADYQNKGITAIIFNEMQKLFNKRNINIVETNPELEENTAIQKLWKNYENRLHKKRATYVKEI